MIATHDFGVALEALEFLCEHCVHGLGVGDGVEAHDFVDVVGVGEVAEDGLDESFEQFFK